jgi:hypothetical protein
MDAKEKQFSATEVNKFCYCRLQWYYERKYGAKQLSEWRKERNASMGWEAGGESAFARGNKFHKGFTRRYIIRLALRRILITAVLAVFLFLLLKYAVFV